MKSKSFLLIIVAMVAMISCVKQELVSESDITSPTVNKVESPINFTALGTKATTEVGDTLIYIEKGSLITLQAATTGPSIKSWSWNFTDDTSTAAGELVSHTFNTLAKSLVRISGVDAAGKKYERTRVVSVVSNLAFYQGVQVISSVKNTDGTFALVLAFHKGGMLNYKGSYAYTGNITDVPWSGSVLVAPADTNCTVIDGKATAVLNAYAKHILVRLNLKNSEYEYSMGVGKISGSSLIWGNFWGPFVGTNTSMVKWKFLADGTVVPKGI